MIGPGVYDHLCTMARENARAEGCILIVYNGYLGSSFCVQATRELQLKIPHVLRYMADEIEKSLKDTNEP